MLTLTLGPLTLTLTQVALLSAFVLALLTAVLVARQVRTAIMQEVLDILLVSVAAARLGFVVLFFEHYQDNWLGLLDVRDGGFSLYSGALAGLVFAGWKIWRRHEQRKALSTAVAVGMLSFAVMAGALHMIEQQGRAVPDLVLQDLNRSPVKLNELIKGQPTVVNLWASWCPPCIREMPVLQAAQAEHPEINFVFINQGEHPQAIQNFLISQQLELENVLSDPQNLMGRLMGSQLLPATLFYDAQGQLVDTHLGGLSRATLARGLQQFTPAAAR